ncbi:MAG: DNA mismatch repair endonuclease MutL [Thermoanaerobacteraceae bacterium]|nr:DNA mismatch repair endonuclease MutL [Thermoanaerobacteraceae bacterium]
MNLKISCQEVIKLKMNKIKILDDVTINKISAGEVIDRPSSIVKELIENSIDANSTRITIEIKNGGIKYIRVSDNGNGIAPDDVEIAFYRHATSKINNYHDINNIYTMGFRGEALASIAAISKINLYTRTHDNILGTHVEYIGGKLIKKENIGCPSGTTLIVEDVFYNTPARYKFLKKESVEAKYVIEVATIETLINAGISFELINNGKMIFKTSGKNNIEENIYDLFGYHLKNHLIPVKFTYENATINGFISDIDFYEKNQGNIILYINNRYVIDNEFRKMLVEAYKSLLTVHQYPVAILNISLPADRIDVNVHPSKLYVKLHDKEKLFDYLGQEIKKALLTKRGETIKLNIRDNIPKMENTIERKFKPEIIYEKPTLSQYKFDIDKKNNNGISELSLINLNYVKKLTDLSDLKYKKIGQIFNTYILLESGKDLYIIDQHAAHERVLYEKYSGQYFSKNITTQILLVPEIISLKHEDFVLIKDIAENLQNLGFEIDTLGDNVVVVRAAPTILNPFNIKDLIMDLIEDMEQTKVKLNEIELLNSTIIKAACKSAVKAYKKLEAIEIDRLLVDLMNCKEPYTCPHGRPTIIKKSIKDIEKLFKRR